MNMFLARGFRIVLFLYLLRCMGLNFDWPDGRDARARILVMAKEVSVCCHRSAKTDFFVVARSSPRGASSSSATLPCATISKTPASQCGTGLRGHAFCSFCPEPSRTSLVSCEARVLTCCFAHLWNDIAFAWMSQLLSFIAHKVVSTQEGNWQSAWLHCGLAFWTCCVCFLETVTGEVAVRSREDVDVFSVCAVPSAPLSST